MAGRSGRYHSSRKVVRSHCRCERAAEENGEPSIIQEAHVRPSQVEQEALNAIILKKKIEEQEKDIRELIMFRFGKETLMEMFELRKQIARDREKAKLKQQRFRRGY